MGTDHASRYLDFLKREIEAKLGWGSSKEWSSQEYKELSQAIFDSTGVALSNTTLKRVFGRVKYDNSPSLTTLNTLACHIGFANWRELKQHVNKNGSGFVKLKFSRSLRWATLVILLFGIILSFTLNRSSVMTEKDQSAIVFESEPVADGYPNSVIFNIEMGGTKSDNMRIQQYWDPQRTVSLKPHQTTATGIYYFPGYFRAKLIIDEQVIKEHDLYLKTKSWMATIDDKPIPTYISDQIISNGTMNVSESVYESIKLRTSPTFLTYHNVGRFDFPANNFQLLAAFKNTYSQRSAVCQTAKLLVLCTKGAMIIPMSVPGCASDLNLMVGDYYLSGKENDLLAFTGEISEWQSIRLDATDKNVDIYINDNLIHQATYEKNLGEIAGVRLSFLGAGEVDYIEIASSAFAKTFREDF